MNYAVRITLPYSKIERGVQSLALRADKVLAYEHVGSATEKVHVHLMIVGARADLKTLKDDMKRGGCGTLKGNGDWSWKTKDKKYGSVEDSVKYVTYMTKGQYMPLYNKGYTNEFLLEAKSLWVDRPKNASRQEQMYYEFEALVPKDLPKAPIYSELVEGVVVSYLKGKYSGFEEVRKMSFQFAMEKCHGILSPGAKILIQTLYQTYCFKYQIMIDPKFDRW